jgi:hypothetical protein
MESPELPDCRASIKSLRRRHHGPATFCLTRTGRTAGAIGFERVFSPDQT